MNALARCTVALVLALAPAWMATNAFAQEQTPYSQRQLDQMLAPVALYPDRLLSQMFMASTYPLEVVEAAQWSRANPGLNGEDAVKAVADEDWDPSVKSLVAFPEVLSWMEQNLDWTRTLGEAFLAQQPQVLDTVQRLRQKARSAGNLHSDQRVSVVDEGSGIAIEPADPALLYLPYYDPALVYGNWWWPGYPPSAWRPLPGSHIPPGYAATTVFWSPPIIISSGFFFGNCDWRHRRVRVVNVNNFYYRSSVNRRGVPARGRAVTAVPENWQHDPAHRRGAAYRLPAPQGQSPPAAQRRFESQRDAPLRPAPQDRATAPVRPETRGVIAPATAPSSRVIQPPQAGGTNPRAHYAAPGAPNPAMTLPQAPRVPRAAPAREEPSSRPRAIAPIAPPEQHRATMTTPPAPRVPHAQSRAASEPPRMVPAPAPRAFVPRVETHAVPERHPPRAMRAEGASQRPVDRAPHAAPGRGSHDRR